MRRKQRREERYERWDRDLRQKKQHRPELQCLVSRELLRLREETPGLGHCDRGFRCGVSSTAAGAETEVQAAEGSLQSSVRSRLPQSLLAELIAELEARKADSREAHRNQAQLGASKASAGHDVKAKTALEEATEKYQDVMKELTEESRKS